MPDDETPDPLLPVSQDLREIETLAADVSEEAAHRGVRADLMAMLGHVANLEAWGYIIDARDEYELDTSHVDDHDPTWEPPLQTLLFWSEQWRVEHGQELDHVPPDPMGHLWLEAGFLRSVLSWAYDHEPRWEDFTADVHKARRRLENVLRAGTRAERGAPCMYDECGGVRLVRKLERDGRRWRHTDWFCPRKPHTHRWDEDAYARMVTAAHEASKRENILGEMWVTLDVAARSVGRSVKTVRTWVNNGLVRRACVLAGKRDQFVALDDVHAEDQRAARRRRDRVA
jgi:hypothetical protein